MDSSDWILFWAITATASAVVATIAAYAAVRSEERQRQRAWDAAQDATAHRVSSDEWMKLALARESVITQQKRLIAELRREWREWRDRNEPGRVSFEQLMGEE